MYEPNWDRCEFVIFVSEKLKSSSSFIVFFFLYVRPVLIKIFVLRLVIPQGDDIFFYLSNPSK